MAGRNELNHLRSKAEESIRDAFRSGDRSMGLIAIADAVMYHAEVLRSMSPMSEHKVAPDVPQNYLGEECRDWVPTRPLWSEQLEDYI